MRDVIRDKFMACQPDDVRITIGGVQWYTIDQCLSIFPFGLIAFYRYVKECRWLRLRVGGVTVFRPATAEEYESYTALLACDSTPEAAEDGVVTEEGADVCEDRASKETEM
jgi:hypothetical protein